MAVVVMGVSGCGKTTLVRSLASALNASASSRENTVLALDGDDFHPDANKKKMARSEPLTDEDRLPWLQTLAERLAVEVKVKRNGGNAGEYNLSSTASKNSDENTPSCCWSVCLACSALKARYRRALLAALPMGTPVVFLWLNLSRELLADRLQQRSHEFMSPRLLESQLQALEPPAQSEFSDFRGAVRVVHLLVSTEHASSRDWVLSQALQALSFREIVTDPSRPTRATGTLKKFDFARQEGKIEVHDKGSFPDMNLAAPISGFHQGFVRFSCRRGDVRRPSEVSDSSSPVVLLTHVPVSFLWRLEHPSVDGMRKRLCATDVCANDIQLSCLESLVSEGKRVQLIKDFAQDQQQAESAKRRAQKELRIQKLKEEGAGDANWVLLGALPASLRSNGNARDLLVARRPLSRPEWRGIFAAVEAYHARHDSNVFELDLRKTRLGDEPEAVQSFCAALQSPRTRIWRAFLFECRLGAELSCLHLLSSALHASKIQELVLCDNSITREGVVLLVAGILENRTLQLLDLNNNFVEDEGARELAKLASCSGPPLRKLSLWNNGISGEGAVVWLESLQSFPEHSFENINMASGGLNSNRIPALLLQKLAGHLLQDHNDERIEDMFG